MKSATFDEARNILGEEYCLSPEQMSAVFDRTLDPRWASEPLPFTTEQLERVRQGHKFPVLSYTVPASLFDIGTGRHKELFGSTEFTEEVHTLGNQGFANIEPRPGWSIVLCALLKKRPEGTCDDRKMRGLFRIGYRVPSAVVWLQAALAMKVLRGFTTDGIGYAAETTLMPISLTEGRVYIGTKKSNDRFVVGNAYLGAGIWREVIPNYRLES